MSDNVITPSDIFMFKPMSNIRKNSRWGTNGEQHFLIAARHIRLFGHVLHPDVYGSLLAIRLSRYAISPLVLLWLSLGTNNTWLVSGNEWCGWVQTGHNPPTLSPDLHPCYIAVTLEL